MVVLMNGNDSEEEVSLSLGGGKV
ncbi:hypothetical protein [Bacillus sp. CMF12]